MLRSSRFAVPALLVLLALVPVAAQDFEAVEIGTEKVADGLYMLTGAGGNLGLSVGADGIFLIDDQYAPLTEKIRAAIAKVQEGPVRFVLNTHWHGDHTGGNENLGKAGTVIVAHDNVRARMSVEQVMEVFGRTVPPSPAAALPVVTFNDTVTFHMNGQTAHALHVDHAHTDGDAIIRFLPADVVHMGDVYFQGQFPFIDTGSGGSIDGVIAACDRVLDMIGPRTKVIPGHGKLSNREELKAYRDMLVGVREAVAKHVRAGEDLAAIQAADPLAPFVETWATGFMKPDVFLKIVVGDLAGKVAGRADGEGHPHDHP